MSSRFVAEKATTPVIRAERNQFVPAKLEKRNHFVDGRDALSSFPESTRWQASQKSGDAPVKLKPDAPPSWLLRPRRADYASPSSAL